MALFNCLFVHSIYIPPSSRPPSSHSLIGDSVRECLDSLQLMSLCITNIVTVSIVSLPMWQKTKAEMCLHHECVCLCWQNYRKPDVRIFLCALYTEQCLSVQIMFHIHKVYISLMGGSEELLLCCTLLAAQCLQTLIPANYRNRHAKFKSLLQTIFHISMRSPYKCESEVNVKPDRGSKCIIQCVVLH